MASRFLKAYKSTFKNQLKFLKRFKASASPEPCLPFTKSIPAAKHVTLDNDMKVVSHTGNSPTSTVGIWINTGSKFETESTNGVAHLLEHFFFKGTSNRTEEQLEKELLPKGITLDAYTKREETAIYAKCLTIHVPEVVEILADIIKNLKIDDSKIKPLGEKAIQGIENVSENDIEQVIMDHLHSVAYQGTHLGFSPLGTSKNIKELKKEDITKYMKENFEPSRMVLAVAGGFDHTEFVKLACKAFNSEPKCKEEEEEEEEDSCECRYTGSEVRIREDTMPFAHVAIAVETCGYTDSDILVLELARIIIGSWDASQGGGAHNSSNLVKYSYKEKLCQSFTSFNIPYQDTGLWGIYYVCDPLQCELMLYNVQNEWLRLCTMPMDEELEQAKEIYKSYLLDYISCKTELCTSIAKQFLGHCEVPPLEELDKQIESISREEFKSVCYNFIYDKCPAVCAMGPIENLPDYCRIRSSMYWLRV